MVIRIARARLTRSAVDKANAQELNVGDSRNVEIPGPTDPHTPVPHMEVLYTLECKSDRHYQSTRINIYAATASASRVFMDGTGGLDRFTVE